MGKLKVALVFLLVVSSLAFTSAEETNTTIQIGDTPPYIIQDIPNILLVVNENAINYLDLDDYFGEDNGDPLAITWEAMDHVTITVDSENRVSFYPETGYIGTQTTRFTVADNVGNVTGNYFNITIAQDSQAPLWFNPQKSKVDVFQNTLLNFTTFWTDNYRLGSYIFSIDQGDGWENYSTIAFSGTQNISRTQVQISASPSSVVYWRYYAKDFYGNGNVTDIQTFTVKEVGEKESPSIEIEGGGGSSGAGGGIIPTIIDALTGDQQVSNFKIDINNLKVSLRQGDTATKVVKITNVGNTRLDFSSRVSGLDRYTVIDTIGFSLEPKETKRLLVDFKIPMSAVPDQYFGFLIISTDDQTEQVPIALEIRKFETEITLEVVVPKEYKSLRAGKTAFADIRLTSIRDTQETPLEIYYAIKDFEGNIINTNSTSIILFTEFEQTLNLTVPEETKNDEYLFYVRATGEGIIDIASDTFFVGSRFRIMKILENFLYLLIFLILLAILIILYLNHKRNKKKQKALELYIMLNELRELVKQGKTEDAIEIYRRIKVAYGQRISKEFQKDKELLKAELNKFASLLKQNPIQEGQTPDTVPPGQKPAAQPIVQPEVKPTVATQVPLAQPTTKPSAQHVANTLVQNKPVEAATKKVVSAIINIKDKISKNPQSNPLEKITPTKPVVQPTATASGQKPITQPPTKQIPNTPVQAKPTPQQQSKATQIQPKLEVKSLARSSPIQQSAKLIQKSQPPTKTPAQVATQPNPTAQPAVQAKPEEKKTESKNEK